MLMENKQGPIIKDEGWSGRVHITGDVIINDGVTLTISPGTIVTFAERSKYNHSKKETIINQINEHKVCDKIESNRCYIQIYGKLIAEGVHFGNEKWGGGIILPNREDVERADALSDSLKISGVHIEYAAV